MRDAPPHVAVALQPPELRAVGESREVGVIPAVASHRMPGFDRLPGKGRFGEDALPRTEEGRVDVKPMQRVQDAPPRADEVAVVKGQRNVAADAEEARPDPRVHGVLDEEGPLPRDASVSKPVRGRDRGPVGAGQLLAAEPPPQERMAFRNGDTRPYAHRPA